MIRVLIKDINLTKCFPLGNLNCNHDCLAHLGYLTVFHFSTWNWWKMNRVFFLNYFHKMLYLKRLTGFWIHQWKLLQNIYWITTNEMGYALSKYSCLYFIIQQQFSLVDFSSMRTFLHLNHLSYCQYCHIVKNKCWLSPFSMYVK